MTYVGHEGGVGVVWAVHGVTGLVFGHEVVEHGRVVGYYERGDEKMCEK